MMVLASCTKVGNDSRLHSLPTPLCFAFLMVLCHLSAPQGNQRALLFFASYACKKKLCSGVPCVYGVKLLGAAAALPDKDPRAGQVDQVDIAPSSGPVVRSVEASLKGALRFDSMPVSTVNCSSISNAKIPCFPTAGGTQIVQRAGIAYSRAKYAATALGRLTYKGALVPPAVSLYICRVPRCGGGALELK